MHPAQQSQIEEAYQIQSAHDCLTFLQGLVIPSGQGPQLFDHCMADFQLKDLQALVPSLEAVRDGRMPPIRRFWIERTKKASKDGDLGSCLLWPLAFPTRPLFLQVGAADKDQAGIIKRRMTDTLYYNPWLQSRMKEKSWNMTSANGLAELDIVAADIAGSHGETPDILVVNELSHVTKWEFVENLLDNADGVPQGIVIIATNAGYKGTPADKLRTNAMESEDWYFSSFRQPAPWINEESVEDAKRRNSKSRYRRLWWGEWASGKGDALDEEDIDRCLRALGGPLTAPKPSWVYLGGLDLGVSHDHAGLAVVGVSVAEQKIQLVHTQAWEPNAKTGEVDLTAVEDACYSVHRTFHLDWLGYDPAEAKLMAQRLTRKGVPMAEYRFIGSNLTSMAQSLMQVVKSGQLECYDDQEGRLRRDFGKFSIVEKSYGYKLEAVSDEYGHADLGTALVITLPKAIEMLRGFSARLRPEDSVAPSSEDFDELTEEEVAEMPDELREIYEMDQDVQPEEVIRNRRFW